LSFIGIAIKGGIPVRKLLILLSLLFVIFGIASCTGGEEILLIFEENGGTEVEDMTISINSTSIELPEPERNGYTFDGWFTNQALTDPFTIAVLLTQQKEITLYAKWTMVQETFTMTFETNGGSLIQSITLAAGSTITPPVDPNKSGFTFGGWYSDVGLSTPYTITTMPNQNITLYAKWNIVIVTATITFETSGGSIVAPLTQNVGTPVTAPAAPTRQGYTFAGWFSDVALLTPYVFGNMPANPITLYAKWTINNYTISFEENGGTQVADITQAYQSTVTQPANPTRDGYTFGGWYSDVALLTPYVFGNMPANSITLYAKWTINAYTITFEENGGSPVADITQAYQSTVTQPANPTRDGYTFGGWYSDITLTNAYTINTMPMGGITLYAKWTINNYTIIFVENGGSLVDDITQPYMSAVTEPMNPTKEGHTFGGWYNDAGFSTGLYVFNTMPLHGATLYAKWTPIEYTITFIENGGSDVTDLTQNYGSPLILPDPIKALHTFDGWFIDESLTIPFTAIEMPVGGAILYAKYSQNQFSLTWNDGSQQPQVDVYGIGQAIITPVAPTKVGYTFGGWFKDQLFLQPFDVTHMPSNDLVAYGKWTINTYTVIYNTHGGDFIIDNETVPFNAQVPNPGIIYKQGMIFDGWYADDAYTIPFDFSSMPASNITIHAKWIIDDGYTRISTILDTYPYHVKVRGIIYYQFPGMNPGFYIYDGTGYMFVLGMPGAFVVGDTVEFEADFQPFENTPQLTNITNLLSNNTPFAMPNYVQTPFENVARADEFEWNLYGQPIIISGMVSKMGVNYYIRELGTDRVIAINYKSVTPMNDPFMAALGSRVTFQAIIHDYNGYINEWHVLYNGMSSEVVVTPYTDQDKVNELLAFGEMMVDGAIFYVGQTFKIPTSEPVFGATIQTVTFGNHAAAYNPVTGTFQNVVTETTIDLRITVTLNQATGFIEVQIILKPVELLTISDFMTADEMGYYKVQGVVLLTHPNFGIAVIADETGTLVIMLDQPSSIQGIPAEIVNQFKVGDLIIVGGYKMPFESIFVMVGGEQGLDIEVLGVDQSSPLDAIPISIEQFLALDVFNPIYWVQYFEIEGTIEVDDQQHIAYLTDGIRMLPIMILDQDMYDSFQQLSDFDIIVRGVSLPNFDGVAKMMFVYTGLPDAIEPNYTDQAFIDFIKIMLQTYLESLVFYPGQIADLPFSHPIFDVHVSYTVSAEDSHLIDLMSMQISSNIEEDTWISLFATITYKNASGIVDIELFVKPIDILTIAEFLQVTDQEMYYVQGVVIFIQSEQSMIMIADATGILMSVSVNPNLKVGDLVLLQGILMNADGMMILANNPENTVISILNSDVPNPLSATPISLEAFKLLDATDPMNHLKYFEITSTLMLSPSEEMFYLTDGLNNIPVFVVSPEGYEFLKDYVGIEVRMKGFAMRAGSESFMVLVFINYPGDVELKYTDPELAAFLADQLEGYYAQKILRPGAFHQLPDSHPPYQYTVSFEVFGIHAGLYNLTTGAISLLIDEETYIDIRATITVGDAVEVVEFQLHVVPIEVQTIAEFLAGEDGDFFTLRVIVVLSNFGGDGPAIVADATGHLFVAPLMELVIGDEVIITGYRQTHEGIALLWDGETTILVEILSNDRPNPMTLQVHTIDSFLALDLENRSNWGIFIEVIGYLRFIDDSYMPLLSEQLGSGDFLPFFPMFLMYDGGQMIQRSNAFEYLRMMEGLRLRLKGFLLPNFGAEGNEPDRMLIIAREEGLRLDYVTDQEKMDALIDIGTYHLEINQIFRPGQQIELPTSFTPLGATMIWTYIGASTQFINLMTMEILEITEETLFLFQAVIRIGELEVTHVFTLKAQPYPILSIDEFYMLEHDEYAKVLVIVAYKTPYGNVIFQDRVSSSYLYGEGYNDLQVGDEVIIFTQKRGYDQFVVANGYAWQAKVEAVAILQTLPYTPIETELQTLANQSVLEVNPMQYHLVIGRLIYNNWDANYYLTDGLNTIMLQVYDLSIQDALSLKVGQDVQLACFNFEFYYTAFGPKWTCIVVQDVITNVMLSDIELTEIMKAYLMNEMGLLFKDGLTYQFSTTHPIYGGTYSFELDPLNVLDATLIGNVINFAESDFPNTVYIHVTASIHGYDLIFTVHLAVIAYDDPMASFNPGSMGPLPLVSGNLPPNTFGGLRIVEIDRQDDWFGGTDMIVDLEFPFPWELGYNTFKLQYFDVVDQAWYDVIYYGSPLVTTWNNFSLQMDAPMTVRLISDQGTVSNSVSFGYTGIETYFAGWMLEQSMYLTGIMNPFVGCGLKLESVTVYNRDGNPVQGGISIQWYRVNPHTWEETPIPGANQSMYVTTLADAGYMMMVQVTGDEIKVGGMMRIYTSEIINILNRGYVTNSTNTGFDIGFDYLVNIGDVEQLQVYNDFGQMLEIISVTATSIPNVFHVEINLVGQSAIQLHLNNMIWTLSSNQIYHDMIGLYVYLLE
jgi:uncharacterized repeat protein (TIGR02543 family)